MEPRTKEEMQAAADKHTDNEDWMRSSYSGMSYADGVRAALEWAMGHDSDEDFMGELPE